MASSGGRPGRPSHMDSMRRELAAQARSETADDERSAQPARNAPRVAAADRKYMREVACVAF